MHKFTTTKTQLMAILNITPDSFFDGGTYLTPELAIKRALELQSQGADILDIGAQSTRPGAVPVPPEEELRRLLPVLEAIAGQVSIPISVDTFHPTVAEQALQHGASIINDVSGRVTTDMANIIQRYNAGWVLMHNGGGADAVPTYAPDIVICVRDSLASMAEQAMSFGLTKQQLCIDPGIGFGKSREDNIKLISNMRSLKLEGIALLVGASRKRVTGEGIPPQDRLAGTIAAHTVAQLGGADILRVHDVREARQAADFTELVITA